ncbi:cobalamin-dependent protein [Gymnodinialimonas sp. 2305UL16-5]|uniref:cobalamin B12-binding domain-containing protein n=1 Tax=Gymnodinialimonas mytili TaxID=3126503 RepID=UPI0030B4BA36
MARKVRSKQAIDALAEQAVAQLVRSIQHGGLPTETVDSMTPPHVTAMACALAMDDESAAEELVHDLLEAGVSIEDLCVDHLAPAARVLGEWWEADRVAFTDVSHAAGRIRAILHSLPYSGPVAACGTTGAIFTAPPTETHTLGVSMAADHFRRLGWDVGLIFGSDIDEVVEKISKDDRRIVGISCAGTHALPSLTDLVASIRKTCPDRRIILSGAITTDPAMASKLPEVDGIAKTVLGAEQLFEKMVERAQPE